MPTLKEMFDQSNFHQLVEMLENSVPLEEQEENQGHYRC